MPCQRSGFFPYSAKLNVVARVLWDEEVEALRKLGVAEMAHPQFEVGLETIATHIRIGLRRRFPIRATALLGLDVWSRSGYPSIVPGDGVSKGQSHPGHGQEAI